MATWAAPLSPENTALKQLSNAQLRVVSGIGIDDGDTYDFGLQVIVASWIGVAPSSYASTSFSGSVVTVHETSGTVAGFIHAWVKDF